MKCNGAAIVSRNGRIYHSLSTRQHLNDDLHATREYVMNFVCIAYNARIHTNSTVR